MTTLSTPMSAASDLYEHFPSERRPLLAVEVTPPRSSPPELLHLAWHLVIVGSHRIDIHGIVEWVAGSPDDENSHDWFRSHCWLGCFVSGIRPQLRLGLAVLQRHGTYPGRICEDITEAAFASTPDEAERGRRALLRRYPDLARRVPRISAGISSIGSLHGPVHRHSVNRSMARRGRRADNRHDPSHLRHVDRRIVTAAQAATRCHHHCPTWRSWGTASLACLFLVTDTIGRAVVRTCHHRAAAALPTSLLRVLVPGQHCRLSLLETTGPRRAAHRLDCRRSTLLWRNGTHNVCGPGCRATLLSRATWKTPQFVLERNAQDHRSEAFIQFGAAVLRARLGQWDRHAANCRDMVRAFLSVRPILLGS